MKASMLCVAGLMILSGSCQKKSVNEKSAPIALSERLLTQPVALKNSKIILPAGTRVQVAPDKSVARIDLPDGYAFQHDTQQQTESLPIYFYATYHCICSGGSTCMVSYDDKLGFGCFHSGCTGTCTGNFIYRGYSVNGVERVSGTRDELFSDPVILQFIDRHFGTGQHELFGVPFHIGIVSKASCDCEGTKACQLKVKKLSTESLVYCEGPCNFCELTIN